MQIRGSNVLITGSNRGIGLAIAEEFAKRGAKLWLAMRQADGGEIAKSMLALGASSAVAIELDMGSQAGIDAFSDRVISGEIPVDILVNNAGQLTGGLLEDQPIKDIYSMFQVNLVGLIHLTARILPTMVKKGRGKIVNNASVSGVMHFPCATTYTAAKTGVVAFTESLSTELKGTGVSTLYLLTPGVKTRMFDEIPKLYGKNMELDFLQVSIPAEDWAKQIADAVESDQRVLAPKGSARIGLAMAQHLPQMFASVVSKKFNRSGM